MYVVDGGRVQESVLEFDIDVDASVGTRRRTFMRGVDPLRPVDGVTVVEMSVVVCNVMGSVYLIR